MIKVEYTLVKWNSGVYRELPITIQQEAVQDFCDMVGWDEKDFSNNTVRHPIYVDDELDPEDPINSEQRIKPIIVDTDDPKQIKKLKKALKKEKRKRRTKEEMVSDGEHIKEQGVPDKRTKGNRGNRYPKELVAFVKKRVDELNNSDLCDEINEEFDLNINSQKVSKWMYSKGIKRIKRVRSSSAPRRAKEEIEKVKKKIGPQKKWTDEVFQYLKGNINNFSNKELCEELESQFNLKTNPTNLQQHNSVHGIKRDHETGANQEIIEFIKKSKIKNVYTLRDKIIEKFEVNMEPAEVRKYMKEALKGEEVADEVKRIQQQREEPEELEEINDIDDIL